MAQGNDKVFVVTGALGSIGFAISTQLARYGGAVGVVGRNAERAREGRGEGVQATGNQKVETLICDLGELASIRKAAAELKQRFPRLDALVCNAADFSRERKTTKDGFELQLGINHLSHFLLANLLQEPLAASGKGRVVVMGMPSKEPLHFDDLMLEKKYSGMTAYARSKAANLYFARELAERWKGKVTVNAIDPGMIKTTLIADAPLPIRIVFALAAKSPEKGAETPVWAATAPELDGVTGEFFGKKKSKPFPPGSEDAAARKRLWDESAKLVGL
jgi:retinol dehydrogenase 14